MSQIPKEHLDRLREAAAALRDVRKERDALLAEKAAPIAVIGMACRFPGGADDPDRYWDLLERGGDAVVDVVGRRWPEEALPVDHPEARWAGLLEQIDGFDPSFFMISPREADLMDPQQRLLLEVAWEAMENAGLSAERLEGSKTGVFIGVSNVQYAEVMKLAPPERLDAYAVTGGGASLSMVAGRISYTFGFRGPAVAVDTACASSLVGLHLACQSLRTGDSDVALAGGVNVLLSPFILSLLTKIRALSLDGRCRTFDARANGFVRAEGCGLVVLKRLSDAQRDGDRVLAVIRGSALNQDGRSSGFTAPNVLAQQDLLRSALANARVKPEDVGYVEAHGTGTSLGDPIELEALKSVLGAPRADGSVCLLGAVKTNIGHLESASGVASFIKVVLSLGRGFVPGNLHFRALNPRVSFEGTPFAIPTELSPWPSSPGKTRIAGVSAFGLSGTNAHVLVEEAPRAEPRSEERALSSYVLPLSAKTPEALAAMARAYGELLSSETGDLLSDVVHTASRRRTHHDKRLAVVGQTRVEIGASLLAHSRGEASSAVVTGSATALGAADVVFVFSGQGSQWAGMGRTLFAEEPAFRDALSAIDASLLPHAGFSVIEELHAPDERSRLGETVVAQPAIFAIEVALAALFRSFGVTPGLVIGHSVGEIAAAHVAGILDLDQASRLVSHRARLMQRATGRGKMVSVALREDEARQELRGAEDRVDIAAMNGPGEVVLSGEGEAVDALVARIAARGVQTKPLRVNYAFHSPQMDAIREDLVSTLGVVATGPGTIPMVSTVSGDLVAPGSLGAAYWGDNVRKCVRLVQAIDRALASGKRIFVEMGPHPVLTQSLAEILASRGSPGHVISTLRRQRDERRQALLAVSELHVRGYPIAWAGVHPGDGRIVTLPSYPWQRKRHWVDPAAQPRLPTSGVVIGHELLGAKLSVASVGAVFESTLDARQPAYLGDHIVYDEAVVPGVALVEMASAAGAMHLGAECCALVHFTVQASLRLPEAMARRVQVVVSESGSEGAEVSIYSQPSDAPPETPWLTHAKGFVRPAGERITPSASSLQDFRARCTTPMAVDDIYARLAAVGVNLGPAFRGIVELWKGRGEAYAKVVLPPSVGDAAHGYRVHPALLDAALQTLAGVVEIPEGHSYLPFEFDEVRLWASGVTEAFVHTRLVGEFDPSRPSFTLAVTMLDDRGNILAEMSDVRIKRASGEALRRASSASASAEWLHRVAWQERKLEGDGRAPSGTWFIVERGGTLAAAVASRLAAAGARCIVLREGEFAARYGELSALELEGEPQGILVFPGQASEEGELDLPLRAERAAVSVLGVIQSILRRDAPTRLWLVTLGAQSVERGDSASVEQAACWGLGRTFLAEHPLLQTKLIDVSASEAGAADAVFRELSHLDDAENQIAWRGGRRLAARLAPVAEGSAAGARPVDVKSGAVLVTGGLGALGLEVARWLWQEHRAGHIVLVSRRAPTGEALAAVEELRARGARVTVASADVSSYEEVAALLAGLPEDMPLRGVIHAAGVLEDAMLPEQDAQKFAAVFAPKVRGAFHLHRATRDLALEFFVLFSSASSVLGNAGQGNYAAANACLDALAHERARTGLAALSLNWGPWARGGMAAGLSDVLRARFSRMGVGVFEASQALSALGEALLRSDPQLVVTPLDLRGLERGAGSRVPPLFGNLVAAKPARVAQPAKGVWGERLAQLDAPARAAEVDASLRAEIVKVLSLASAGEIDEDRPLQELGLDSLVAVELRNAISARVGKPLPATLLFDYPTLRALRTHLLDRVLSFEQAKAAVAPAPARRPLAEDAIAVIGIGCRFPGGARDAKTFWRLLDEGIDAIREVPKDRWDIDAYYDADPDAPGKMTTRWGGFVDDIDRFDAAFFGISPREARSIDPQQRLLLETTWEALEHAGIPAPKLVGTDTGVYVGITGNDYLLRVLADPMRIDAYSVLGTQHATTVGRISYWLGLQGPNIAIDTACSSSLVALHLACKALRSGECSLALAGGVNALLAPEVSVFFSRMKAMSPTGRCHTFSADADGYVRADGCGMLVLKRLSDAIRDGDSVLAIVRGTAVNQDGRSQGLTAPNGPAQEAVIREALRVSGARPSDIDYVEAHGTGTPLGDPIEVQALGGVFGEGRAADAPLWVGSVKTNFGHTEGAAGVAGLIKAVLSLHHAVVPRSLHFAVPNPRIAWSELPIEVVSEKRAWPARQKPRMAGVSSFGASGTNAHVVLEEAAPREPRAQADEARAHLLPLSAKSPAALRALARAYGEFLSEPSDVPLADIVFTATGRRAHHEHRLFVVGATRGELSSELASFAKNDAIASEPAIRAAKPRGASRLVFVFSGQGSQWVGMGLGLMAAEPVFRDAMKACDAALAPHTGFSIVEELSAPEGRSRLDETVVVQPALFAIQVALSALLRAWGVAPSAVIGHSVGEIAAAHVAGLLDLSQASRLVALRARIMQKAMGGGKMIWFGLPREEAEKLALVESGILSIAAVNAPSSVVLSGETSALAAVTDELSRRGVSSRSLRVEFAFHSAQMEPFSLELEEALRRFDARPAGIDMYSTVSGSRVSAEAIDAHYWGRNVRQTVRFADAVMAALADGATTFVEVAPHAVLLSNLEECLAASDGVFAVSTLRRGRDERRSMLEAAGALYARGQSLDWAGLAPGGAGRVVPLPTYPFQRERFWIEAPSRVAAGFVEAPAGGAPPTDPEKASSAPLPARLIDLLQRAPTADERSLAAETHVLSRVAEVLRADPKMIDPRAPFSTLGMDSLMGLELRNRLEPDVGKKLGATLIFAYPTVVLVAEHLIERLGFSTIEAPAAPPRTLDTREAPALLEIPAASAGEGEDDDVEARLEAKLAALGEYLD